MFAGPSNGDRVQQFKEIEVQHLQQVCGCAFCCRPLAPCVKCLLCIFENIINAPGRVQLLIACHRHRLYEQAALAPVCGDIGQPGRRQRRQRQFLPV